MVRRGLKILGWLIGLGLLLLVSYACWLFGTSSGAGWLVARVNQLGTVQIEADIQGSLWGGLDLGDLRVAWPGGQAQTTHLHLAWQPQSLLTRKLAIDQLEIGAVRVTSATSAPAAATPLRPPLPVHKLWPQLPAWLFGVSADIQAFSVAELSFGAAEHTALVLGDLRGSLQFADGQLQGDALHVLLPCGSWDGSARLDLSRRQLAADLLWHGAPFVADWDGVHARINLDENLTGTLQAESLAGNAERITLQAKAALSFSGVTLMQLAATRSGAADRVAGTLQIDWGGGFRLGGDLQLTHLNLVAEAGWPTDLSGSLLAELTSSGYSGSVDLESFRPGLERGRLAGSVVGNWRGLSLTEVAADWLGGTVAGDLRLDWQDGFQLTGALQGRDINPASLVPDMSGRLQLQVSGALQVSPAGELSASWDVDLEHSILQNRPLAGRVTGRWQQHDLLLEALDLQGDGLHVKGSGQLSRRVELQFQVADLARLGRGWQGALEGQGWLAREQDHWRGAASGSLQQLQLEQLRAAAGRFRFDYPGPAADSSLELGLTQLTLPQGDLDEVTINGQGRLEAHQLAIKLAWPSGALAGDFSGGWSGDRWSGQVGALSGHEDPVGAWRLVAPAELVMSRGQLEVGQLQLLGEHGGVVFLTAKLQPKAMTGSLQASWQELQLGYFNPWLGELALAGDAGGELQLELQAGGALKLTAEIVAAPVVHWQGGKLVFDSSRLSLTWDETGLAAEGELKLAQGGGCRLVLVSAQPGRARLPDQGSLKASWEEVDLRQFTPWLPNEIALHGRWQGAVAGSLQPGKPLQLSGRTWITEGDLQWQAEDGVIDLPLRQAELTGSWQAGLAEGQLKLALAEQGRFDGTFRLPVGHADAAAPLQAEASFSLDELGLLMLLMPGMTNETRGAMQGDLRLAGSWSKPQLFGKLSLRGASAEVPALGLKLQDAELEASFDDSVLKLTRLQLVSGTGRLEGKGELQLSGWRPQHWSLNLKGSDVQLVNLPEINLEVTPDLQLSGTPELLSVRGEVQVPTLLANEVPRAKMIEPSEDVVMVDAEPEAPTRVFEQLDVKLQIKLGKHVAVKAKGLDARLEGDLVVATNSRGAFIGQGEIRVAQGHYAAYGIKLPIIRGRAAFGGGALQDPVLDVLAERTVGEVKAGVQVTGPPRKPVVKLVSEPTLPDTEILSYIVLGRPLGSSGGEQDSLMLAAGALLSQGESAALQEKLKRSFGLDVLEVQSGGAEGVQGSMVAVGKYLTPELYLSFGQSLFTRESLAKLRYQLSKRWELESQIGTVSGADLSYRIEFR
jgi:translocation and assembly module TamB